MKCDVTMVLLGCLLLLGSLSGLQGRTVNVDWTLQGVEDYLDPRYDEQGGETCEKRSSALLWAGVLGVARYSRTVG